MASFAEVTGLRWDFGVLVPGVNYVRSERPIKVVDDVHIREDTGFAWIDTAGGRMPFGRCFGSGSERVTQQEPERASNPAIGRHDDGGRRRASV